MLSCTRSSPITPRAAIAAALATVFAAAQVVAQPFQAVERLPESIQALPEFMRVGSPALPAGQVYRIDWAALDRTLADAQQAFARTGESGPWSEITLPMRAGPARFSIIESPVMDADLAERFPQFRTYRVRGIDDPTAIGRLDVTSQGLRGMIRTSGGAEFIDPSSARQREYISVYRLSDFAGGAPPGDQWTWSCGTGPEHGAAQPAAPAGPPPGTPTEPPGPIEPAPGTLGLSAPLRTYRLALACSGEYGAYQSELQGRAPNAQDALAAIVTVTNRANVVFEADIGVRFLLVASNHLIAYFNPETDPYPNADPTCTSNPAADCSGPYLAANITALNDVIGTGNFDIGHVLTRVRGGVAYLRAVCGNFKGGGVSGVPRGGEVSPVSALVVMHEMGHQFGANHTFNGVLGRCNANINGTTNWEPGGGSTLLAYAGACPVGGAIGEGDTDNLVQFADPYFHGGSLNEMRSFLAASASSCFGSASTGNTARPAITSLPPSGLWIPPATPFALTAAVTDDGPAPTFCWEEFDLGPAQRLTGPTSADNGLSPLFRSLPPSASPTRTFPRIDDVLSGVENLGERSPTVAGSARKFRLTVRDNQGASVTSDIVTVNIADAPPFRVGAPAAGQQVRGPLIAVAWNSSAIAGPPLGVASVAVSLSLDGGRTFPISLGEWPNTGLAMVPAPGRSSGQARVRVSAPGNVFFNVSGEFTLLPACAALDLNGDGATDPDDLSDFIAGFFATPPAAVADFNGDGAADPDDLSDYISAYFSGC